MIVEVFLSNKDKVEHHYDFEINNLEFIPVAGDRIDFRGWVDESKLSEEQAELFRQDAKVYDRCVYKKDNEVRIQLICMTV